MSNIFNQLKANEIYEFHQRHDSSDADIESVKWVIKNWPETAVNATALIISDEKVANISATQKREFTIQDLQAINKVIRIVPTGKQRQYKNALEAIVTYLKEILQWQIPQVEKLPWPDPDLVWYQRITANANDAYKLHTEYEKYKAQFFKQRFEITAEFVALAISLEIAPLSIVHLINIINDKDSIQQIEAQIYLNVKHLVKQPNNEQQQSSRYHLPLFVYQLLSEYQSYSHKQQTEKRLLKSLTNLLTSFEISSNSSRLNQHLFQAVWHYRDHIVPSQLKDISYPERHVANPIIYVDDKTKKQLLSKIYNIDYDKKAFTASTKPAENNKWPHRKLLKRPDNIHSLYEETRWPLDNILPTMLYRYTLERIVYGGVRKSNLADSTIEKYCNIQSKFAERLSYDRAIDQEQLQLWAHTIYNSLETETEQLIMLYFFRFMRQQSITDHLNLSEFESPLCPPSVDPFRISLEQLHEIVSALLTQKNGHLLQRLFCAVAVIVCYFAMLRRSELLHLRLKDVFVDPSNPNLFRLYLGKTKSGHSRVVYTVIPEEFAVLVRIIIKNKALCEPYEPLIGFTDEPNYSRQLHYLLPVTKAIKAICGSSARFHHLRHSGIHLFTLQAFHLAYEQPARQTTNSAHLQRLLDEEALTARFEYWLEEQPFTLRNDAILIDEIIRQIGHENYATTRWSYLHDIDWLYPFYRAGNGELQPRKFSHSELRYLLGLANDSNDLSRQLALISEVYKAKDTQQKRDEQIILTESTLRQHLFKTAKSSAIQHCDINTNLSSFTQDTIKYYQQWLGYIEKFPFDFLRYLFLEMRKAKEVNWPLLSQIWHYSGKHQYSEINKTQITALRNLPEIQLSNETQTALTITLACNVKNARHFTAVFRQQQWKWLTPSFSLTVNRKTKVDRLVSSLKQHFARSTESISVHRQPLGQSALTITLTPKLRETKLNPHKRHTGLTDLRFVIQQTQHYLTHFQKK
ncbi:MULTISPECIES: hypothetical protein [Shewanella]|uniref:Site-specific integrase n=1 Tax=Shewanella marisflavi TaxID=260364 RepID=A0ABX5WTG5_9GAMM|nr:MULTISPECIES: hypothetical protein [Shewanella]QDF75849.1 hypothetical protein FGA12_12220 [Shewanella marisflavi]